MNLRQTSHSLLLNNETLCMLYNCFVYPYLNYCVDIWGDTFKTHLQTLVKLQKRVLRIISYSTWRASVDHLYKYYGIMQLKKIHFFKVALLMFRVKNMSAPLVLRELFTENIYVHDYNTRQKDKFYVLNAKRNYLQRTISYKGVVIWNYISVYVTYDCSLASFKFALRKHVTDNDTLLDIF